MRKVELHYMLCRISQAHEAPAVVAERVVGGDVSDAQAGCDVAELPIERERLGVEAEQPVRYPVPRISPIGFVQHHLWWLRPSRNRTDHDNPRHADPLKTTHSVADSLQMLILRPGRGNNDDVWFEFGK